MNNSRGMVIGIILISCLVTFAFADDAAKAVQAVESDARIMYNGREVVLGNKPFAIQGYNYLSVRSLAELFNKNIEWNQAERKVIISDKPDAALENLKSELAAKDKMIAELQDEVKKLETDLAGSKKLSMRELQEKINDEYGEYEGVTYKVILSGNEDEVRVKIETDLSRDKSAWSRLTSSEREGLVKEVCSEIEAAYFSAKIKGYIKDIAASSKLMSFQYDWQGELLKTSYRNFSTISTLEDSFNNDFDRYFKGVHFTFALQGNESNMEYMIYVQENRFKEEWKDITDGALKNFMKKLCSEINYEFKECHVTGYVFDIESGRQLAFCEQIPQGDFIFEREQ